MYQRFFKRFFDIAFSLIAIIVLSLPMAIIAVAIKLDSSGPICFKQKRIGINKSHFWIYKFRSMPSDTPTDVPTHLMGNTEVVLSPFQRFIRKSSIDELPQLFNVLFGSMSIVGPRPALWNQFDLAAERDKYGANGVKPGITGWAQINGRDEIDLTLKAQLDGEYTEQLKKGGFSAFLFDAKCFFLTFKKVLTGSGVRDGNNKNG